MESTLSLIGLAIAALLVVAVAVAVWEQFGARAAARRTLHAPPRHDVSVDVRIDDLAGETAQRASDQAARQAALGSAMARMARASPYPTALSWIDTQPDMGAGPYLGPGNRHAAPGPESRTGH